MKCLNRWSNKSLTMLLELLQETVLESENVLANYYETILYDLGLDYKKKIKIDACPLYCILHTKEYANNYIRCGISRWKNFGSNSDDGSVKNSKDKKIPTKVCDTFL